MAVESRSAGVSGLAGLPTEIFLEIYAHLDVSSTYNLSSASRHLLNLFRKRKVAILLPVLQHEFSPFDELLQVHTASFGDLIPDGKHYKPRMVVFRRFLGDSGLVVAKGPDLSSEHARHFLKVSKALKSSVNPTVRTTYLTEKDLVSILAKCRLVRQWEEWFPHMRWNAEPENCRSLRSHEQERFRRALYRWWLYSLYYHVDSVPRTRSDPEPFVEDMRTSQLRYHSTAELLEMLDLVATTEEMIRHYICPRLQPGNETLLDFLAFRSTDGSRAQILRHSWSDETAWSRIVRTYAKLGPEELMHFVFNIHSYPCKKLISSVRADYPMFTADQASMHAAIRCVLCERGWASLSLSQAEHSRGGILDFDDGRDDERLKYGHDGHPAGLLPPGVKFVRARSQYWRGGDDGSTMADDLYLGQGRFSAG